MTDTDDEPVCVSATSNREAVVECVRVIHDVLLPPDHGVPLCTIFVVACSLVYGPRILH